MYLGHERTRAMSLTRGVEKSAHVHRARTNAVDEHAACGRCDPSVVAEGLSSSGARVFAGLRSRRLPLGCSVSPWLCAWFQREGDCGRAGVFRGFERVFIGFVTENFAFSARRDHLHRVRRAICIAFFAATLAGCFATRSSTDKLLDAAHEHNGAVRFGRMDIALDHVSASAKDEWLRRRATWKNGVRIVDVELESMQLSGNNEANVQVRVAWQRVDEADLRSTEVVQKWRASSGPWQLVTEDCTGGDAGLLAGPKTAKP